MVILLLLVLTIVFIGLGVIFDWDDSASVHIIKGFLIFFLCLCLIQMVDSKFSAEADKASFQQRYNSLVYQLESGIYDKDNHDIATGVDSLYELHKEIETWNTELASRKVMSKSAFGVFFMLISMMILSLSSILRLSKSQVS